MGQLRWAQKSEQRNILGKIRTQLRNAGLCTKVRLLQHGRWEQGRQAILQDVMRSIGQLGGHCLGSRGQLRC
eukprot:gene21119-biopygen7100